MPAHLQSARPGLSIAWLMLGIALAAIAGCAPQPVHEAGAPVDGPVRFPAERYARLADAGQPVYRLRPELSSVRIYIYRAGPMAEMGHNHVAAAKRLRGAVHLPTEGAAEGRFDIVFEAQDLILDRAKDREAAGPRFAEALSAKAVRKTRENMLGPEVLAAAEHPRIGLDSVAVIGRLPVIEADVGITIAGRRIAKRVTLYVTVGDGRLRARGQFRVAQTELGIAPFRVGGGALRVADELGVHFDLVAERL